MSYRESIRKQLDWNIFLLKRNVREETLLRNILDLVRETLWITYLRSEGETKERLNTILDIINELYCIPRGVDCKNMVLIDKSIREQQIENLKKRVYELFY